MLDVYDGPLVHKWVSMVAVRWLVASVPARRNGPDANSIWQSMFTGRHRHLHCEICSRNNKLAIATSEVLLVVDSAKLLIVHSVCTYTGNVFELLLSAERVLLLLTEIFESDINEHVHRYNKSIG